MKGGVYVTDIVWETDNEKVKLPKKLYIDFDDLNWENQSLDDLIDRVSDYLSDKYGWLVKNYCVAIK